MTAWLDHLGVVPEPIVALGLCLKVALALACARLTARAVRPAGAAAEHRAWAVAFGSVAALVVAQPFAPRIPVALPVTIVPGTAGAAAHPWWPVIPARALVLAVRLASSVWLAGAVAMAARLALGWIAAGRLVRGARPAPRAWAGGRVRVLMSDRLAVPVVCGVLRPAVVLPADAARWTCARRDAVLRHERAHIERHDTLLFALAELAQVLFWFDPQVRHGLRALRRAAERACDDRVLASGWAPLAYARHLLAVARASRGATAPRAAVAMTGAGELETRVAHILEGVRPRSGRGGRAGLVALALWIALLVPLALLRTHL